MAVFVVEYCFADELVLHTVIYFLHFFVQIYQKVLHSFLDICQVNHVRPQNVIEFRTAEESDIVIEIVLKVHRRNQLSQRFSTLSLNPKTPTQE